MIAPIIVNRKYMGAGLAPKQEELVPLLEIPPPIVYETQTKAIPPMPEQLLPPPIQ
jgi:hypothetical protein